MKGLNNPYYHLYSKVPMPDNKSLRLFDLNPAGITTARNPRNLPPSQRMNAKQLCIAAILAPTNGSPYQFDSYLPEELESYHLAAVDFFQTYCQENPSCNNVVNPTRIRLDQDFTALYNHVSRKSYIKRISNVYLLFYSIFIIIFLFFIFIFFIFIGCLS